MFKFLFLIFAVSTFTLPSAHAQKAPKSEFMKIYNSKGFEKDNDPIESGVASWLVSSAVAACAAVYDGVNYACYYGKKALSSTSAKTGKKGFGNGGDFGGGGSAGSWDDEMPKQKESKSKVHIDVPIASSGGECQWDLSQIPRIVFAPGCTAKGSRLCRGMVVCGNKKRLATCSENFCTPNTATECSKQKGYSTKAIVEAVAQN